MPFPSREQRKLLVETTGLEPGQEVLGLDPTGRARGLVGRQVPLMNGLVECGDRKSGLIPPPADGERVRHPSSGPGGVAVLRALNGPVVTPARSGPKWVSEEFDLTDQTDEFTNRRVVGVRSLGRKVEHGGSNPTKAQRVRKVVGGSAGPEVGPSGCSRRS
jgi:hypothetical protein